MYLTHILMWVTFNYIRSSIVPILFKGGEPMNRQCHPETGIRYLPMRLRGGLGPFSGNAKQSALQRLNRQ